MRTPFSHLILFSTAVLVLVGCGAKAPLSNMQTPQSAHLTTKQHFELNYLAYLPKDYESKSEWPLVLFLHGSGERGSDLNLIKKHGLPMLVAEGQDFPFILISPQCPEDDWWDPYALDALMDSVVKKYKADESRLYATGLSMGGYGTWSLAQHNPERFAAIAPVCGGGNRFSVKRLVHTPVWAFHGAKDTVVLPEESQEMVDEINKAGGEAKLTIYPDATHNSWTRTYNNPELYEWLLSHQKPAKE